MITQLIITKASFEFDSVQLQIVHHKEGKSSYLPSH